MRPIHRRIMVNAAEITLSAVLGALVGWFFAGENGKRSKRGALAGAAAGATAAVTNALMDKYEHAEG